MRYNLRHGTKRRNLKALQALKEAGKPIARLDDAPVVHPAAKLYWEAWNVLDGSRWFREKLVPQPLAPRDLQPVAEAFGFAEAGLRREFFQIMRRLDDVVLAHFATLKERADAAARRAATR